jgi:hypothetical protein
MEAGVSVLRTVSSAFASLLASLVAGQVVFCGSAILGLLNVVPDSVVNAVNLTLPWLVLGVAVLLIWKRVSCRITLPVLGLGAGCLLYLAWDGSSPPPLPPLPGYLEQSSKPAEIWQWMSKSGTGSRLAELETEFTDLPVIPPTIKAEEFATFVLQNRKTFDEAWKTSLIGREWVEAMAENSGEVIFPASAQGGSMPSFPAIRRVVVVHWCHAQLQFMDGRPDDALRTLILLVRACHSVQRSGTSLLNQMIANVSIKGTHDLMERFVEAGGLSPAAYAELADALHGAPTVSHSISMLFLGEELEARSYVERVRGIADLKGQGFASVDGYFPADRILRPFLFNPNRTLRDYVQFLREARDLGIRRDLSALTLFARQFEERIERKRLKNPVGRALQLMLLPAFNKVMESLWQEEERRLRLIQRLSPLAKGAGE